MQESTSDRSGGSRDNQPKRNLPSWMNSKGTGGNSGKKIKSDNGTPKEATKEVRGSGASSRDHNQNNATGFSKLLVKLRFNLCFSFHINVINLLILSFI